MEATSARTLWRDAYGMPPTDPRFLEADEETIIRDLLVRMLLHERQAAGPASDVLELAANPDAVAAMLERQQEAASSQATRRAIDRALGRSKASKPRSIRFGRGKVR